VQLPDSLQNLHSPEGRQLTWLGWIRFREGHQVSMFLEDGWDILSGSGVDDHNPKGVQRTDFETDCCNYQSYLRQLQRNATSSSREYYGLMYIQQASMLKWYSASFQEYRHQETSRAAKLWTWRLQKERLFDRSDLQAERQSHADVLVSTYAE